MWWYGCSNVPSMFFGPIIMLVFLAACMTMLFFMMRRHLQPGEHAPAAFFGSNVGPWRNAGNAGPAPEQTSAAFEAYRDNTLRRLEEEQTAFKSFLDQLRRAKDRTEFDQFMTQRKSG